MFDMMTLGTLSEESIYQLMLAVGRQVRKAAALRSAGKESGDLVALTAFFELLVGIYIGKLDSMPLFDELPEVS